MDHDDGFFKSLLDNLYDGVYFVDRERRITYWNRGAEALTGYRADEVTGSRCSDDLLMHVDVRGRRLCPEESCPVAQAIDCGSKSEMEIYLHHKEGHRVPVRARAGPIWNAEGEFVGAVEVFSDNSATVSAREQVERLRRTALLDPLTELGNRRYGEKALRDRVNELDRYGWRFGVLFIDLDRFKDVNDRHGHEIGDKVLRTVARTVVCNLRSFDAVCRWGGDELLAVITNVDERGLRTNAEKLSRLVASSGVSHAGKRVRVTVSIGAVLAGPGDSAESLVREADARMYRSKSAGGNRVSLQAANRPVPS